MSAGDHLQKLVRRLLILCLGKGDKEEEQSHFFAFLSNKQEYQNWNRLKECQVYKTLAEKEILKHSEALQPSVLEMERALSV